MSTGLAPLAPSLDAVGEERYALDSRYFLGAVIDLEETYLWGWEELHRIQQLQRSIAQGPGRRARHPGRLRRPGRRPEPADHRAGGLPPLDAGSGRPARSAISPACTSTSRIRSRPSSAASPRPTTARSTTPIPPRTSPVPARCGGPCPTEIDTFSTWKEVTTVYHEGVPGHHLQIAQNAYRSDLLNRWQRKLCFCSGHSEGWALYAEQLMDDLGYLEPGDRMGMLDAQAFRAIRVIIDIGMHLQLKIPPDNPCGFRPG